MRRMIGSLFIFGVVLVMGLSTHADLYAQSDEAEDVVAASGEVMVPENSQQNRVAVQETSPETNGTSEEEWEEEACDCGTMAEGECAPCPDGYDE